jgi:hypothetical protein
MNRRGLNLLANGEEGAKRVIHRLGIREVLHDIRIKNREFVPCWSKLAYLPRTAVGLAAVPEVSGFFIEFSLGWSSEWGADDYGQHRLLYYSVALRGRLTPGAKAHSIRFDELPRLKPRPT